MLLERLESSGSVSDDKLLCFDNVYHELDARGKFPELNLLPELIELWNDI